MEAGWQRRTKQADFSYQQTQGTQSPPEFQIDMPGMFKLAGPFLGGGVCVRVLKKSRGGGRRVLR